MVKKKLKVVEVTLEDLNPSSSDGNSSDESLTYKPYIHRKHSTSSSGKSRFQPKRKGQRYSKETNNDTIKHVIASGCCNKGCLKQFNKDVILQTRTDFFSKTHKEQSEFIVQQLRLTLVYDSPNADTGLAVKGKPVCLKAWQAIHGIKKRRYDHLKKLVKQYDDVHVDDPRCGQHYSSKLYMKAFQFMTDYVKHFGEDQPDSTDIHLPSCVTKASVYIEYKTTCEVADQAYFKLRRFYEMWSNDFHHVKIRKYQTFSKCLACTNFKEALLKKPSKEEKKKIIEMRTAHLNLQRLCREKYYKHNAKAEEEPDKYISIIIDGMDQSKTSLPRFYHQTKADSTLSRMHHRVTGVLCQSGRLHSYAFTYTDEFSADANVTANCLMKVLDDICKKRNGSLPPVLYVQADNCAGDNKNNYMLYFLSQLVKAGVFRKTQKALVNDVGGYCERSKHMGADPHLCRALSQFLKGQIVASFGEGTGEYKNTLDNMGAINSYDAFDGGPYSEKETSGIVKFIDLSIPQYGLKLYDWILSIEVAEHIPEKFEDIYLNNLFRHAKKGIILSWAVPGQGGISHINNKPLEHVFKKMEINGFSVNITSSKILQNACSFEHLKRNIHVYQRDNTNNELLHLFI